MMQEASADSEDIFMMTLIAVQQDRMCVCPCLYFMTKKSK
jgi:hypothetical protein